MGELPGSQVAIFLLHPHLGEMARDFSFYKETNSIHDGPSLMTLFVITHHPFKLLGQMVHREDDSGKKNSKLSRGVPQPHEATKCISTLLLKGGKHTLKPEPTSFCITTHCV